MAERSEWHHHDQDDASQVDERVRVAEEQRVQAEGRCFAAERRRLDAERRLEQVEALLEEALQAGTRMRGLVGELSELASTLRRALEAGPAAPTEDTVAAEHRTEMVDALASAVERLRARVDEVKSVEPEPEAAESGSGDAVGEPVSAQPAQVPARPSHKHSMSAVRRWRNKRKQRQSA
ncbi:MAG TPA: hypothetical protein VHS55_01460 [Solirubrobacteraceae bacterium]|jgi:hypothetical protein|nr:hypothetical protein [Solirubrobacteraceae bacterium]